MVHPEGDASAIESARSRSTLLQMLTSAGIDGDIVNDVADACEIKEYTVMHLASKELGVEEVARELYLTDEEALKLQESCQAELKRLDVCLAEGGDLPAPLEEDEAADKAPTLADNAKDIASPVPAAAVAAAEKEEEAWTPEAPTPGGLVTPPPAPAPTPATECESVSNMSTISVVNTPMEPTPTSKPVRPQSAPPKATKTVPLYLKPTESAMKKIKEDEAANAKAIKSRPTSASVKISSSLLRPTAASKAHSTGQSESAKARLHSTCTGLNNTPRNRGPTTPRPFKLSGHAKKENVMSTEELQVAMAKAKMQALKEERLKTSRVMSAPPKQRQQEERPLTEFKPFSLTSMALHEKARNSLQQQAVDAKRKEEQARKFKARPATYGKGKTYQDVRSTVEGKLSESKTFTVGQAPKFRSEERIEMHRQLDEEKRIKEAERKVQEAEEERLAKEQEERDIKEMRRQLQFQASSMPDFSAPFKPDFSDSPAPTQAKTPRFATDMRAPRAKPAGESNSAIVVPSADNQNYFASTLRGSKAVPSVTPGKKNIVKDVHVEVKAQ